jgi:membrane-bound ClpP family serine protease
MPFLKKVIHTESLATASAGELEYSHVPGLQEMVGSVGQAITSLRPAGRAEFDDVLLDVVTTGEFLDRGAPVRILEVHGSRVVVEGVQETI